MKLVALLVTLVAFAPVAAAKKTGVTPISGRVLKVDVQDKELIVTVGAGSDQGVDKAYACSFIAAGGTPLVGKCLIIRVNKVTTTVKTDLPRDKVMNTNTTVKLGPIFN